MSRFGSNKYTQNMRKNRETEQVFASGPPPYPQKRKKRAEKGPKAPAGDPGKENPGRRHPKEERGKAISGKSL